MNDKTRLRVIALLNAMEEGSLDEKQQAELVEVLKASDEAQELYLRFQTLSAGLGEYAREGVLPAEDVPVRLDELARLEEQAEPITVTVHDTSGWASPKASVQDWRSAAAYLVEHTFTPKRLVAVAAAAVLLLGVVLSIVLLTGGEETPETATLPDFTPVKPAPDLNRVVATVTDQVNAQWVSANGQGALPDRMLLAVNQRLTLAKGFAEITTNRGAKVLLQAPATIETTGSDNAIRLHRGKLVGICETPSSKGFVVHAPGVDVVDLGTRFGVEADAEEGSTVLVMEGSVRAEPAKTSPLAFEPMVLLQDDARRIEPETGELEVV
ncbi:MAG: FecR domain-containing protein, partial [Planctomycetota bacterium]